MRKKILAANWKMNLLKDEAIALHRDLNSVFCDFQELEIVIFPPSIYIMELQSKGEILLGIQNIHFENSGAFTGEISANQAKSIGCYYALVGHSERRHLFSENDSIQKSKVDLSLQNGLKVIFACGEALDTRNQKTHLSFVLGQLKNSLLHLSHIEILNCVIAYEPIWAIGTGLNASSEEVEEMHGFIRSILSDTYSKEISQKISIIYGGSCNTTNARALFACPNVDGALVGGASLISDSFIELAKALR